MITKPELGRDAIVERALDIADVEGLDAITARRISKEFGVTPMALYWHVRNKEDLLDGMGDALFTGISAEVDPADRWPDQLRALLVRLVEAFRRHPGATPLAYARVLQCEPGLQLAEVVFRLLLDEAGFDTVQAAHLGAQALRTAVVMVNDEPGRTFGDTDEARQAAHQAKQARLAALPADDYPHLRRVGGPLLECDPDEYYRTGIDLYLAGVEGLAASAAAQSRA